MQIGLTYDLRSEYLAEGYSEDETAEFDRDDTIDAIEIAVRRWGHTTDRIGHARNLMARLAAGDRWDFVFNIAEGLNGIGREAQVPAVLDVHAIPYTFSDPMVMSLTLHKGMTKRVVRDAGMPTPDFAVIESSADIRAVNFDPPYFVKPVAEGTGKGITGDSIVRTRRDLAAACETLRSAYRQPVLVERYLSGREFTAGIVGTGARSEILGTIEVLLLDTAEPGVYSYGNKENSEELVRYRRVRGQDDPVVAAVESICLRAWRVLGCRDAGRIDIRCDAEGNPFFLEVNPLAGLHPEHSDLPIICGHVGMTFQDLVERIMASAAERVPAMAN